MFYSLEFKTFLGKKKASNPNHLKQTNIDKSHVYLGEKELKERK